MGKIPLRLGVSLLSVFFALLLSEIFLRIFWHPPYLDPKYKRDDFSWMSKNVILNNFGYRDEDVNLSKKPNTIRIYSLGDSFTYGWYIDDAALAYPNVLEKRLKERFSEERIEVVNASQPGFKVRDSIERYRAEGMFFSPDMVTLGINLFDLTFREFPPRQLKFPALAKLRIYELTFGNWERARISRLTQAEFQNMAQKGSSQLGKFQEEIKEFNQLVKSTGAVLVVIIFPDFDPSNPNKPYVYKSLHNEIKEIASKEVKVIDLLDTFEKVEDKKILVLNPTDDHPTILAHSLAVDYVMQEFDFTKFLLSTKTIKGVIKSRRISLGDKLEGMKGIIGLTDKQNTWVYFDRLFDLGAQKRTLENTGDRQLSFTADYLKTAKSLTHDGWPGAKIEMHFPPVKEIIIKREIYGYPIIGIHQFTVFKREEGSTISRNLDLNNLAVTRDSQNIKIKVLLEENFDFYRVNFDVAVNQLDIDGSKVVSFIKTELVKVSVNESIAITSLKYSLPKFIGDGGNYGYVWYGDTLRRAKFVKVDSHFRVEFVLPPEEDMKIEIPMGVELKGRMGPIINYII